jgi:8-oxo-dGTP pyrophosphatase MutT (NUDIX family)
MTAESLSYQIARDENTFPGFSPKAQVSIVLFSCAGQFLLLQRVDNGLWALPGGKLEKDETPLQALLRELHEETGYLAQEDQCQYLKPFYARHKELDYVLHIFKITLSSEISYLPIELCLEEHQAYIWLNPKEAIAKLKLMPGERELFQEYFIEK